MLRLPDVQSLRLNWIRERQGVVVATPVLGYAGPSITPQRGTVNLTALMDQGPATHTVHIKHEGMIGEWQAETSANWLRLQQLEDSLRIIADPYSLPPGAYQDTVRLISALGDATARIVVDLRVALPGIPEIIASELPWSWGLAVRAGRVLQASYGWDALGLRPRPRVLQLWDGTFHPATLGRIPADALYAPTIVDDNNSYVIARARTANYLYRLDASGNATVVASDIGSGPAYGAALMPDNTVIIAEWSGKLHRVTANGAVHPYGRLNANIYQIATDAFGTLYATTFNGEVIRMSPDGASSVFATGFAKGKLVAIAVSRSGDVYVAERGDHGRILRINADGTRQIMLQSKGAQFYGLAVDEQFLYAIDMRNRQLLRIPMDAVPARPLVAEAAPQPHD
jgi:hypothetical protein